MRTALFAAVTTVLLFAASTGAQRDSTSAGLSFDPSSAPAWSWAYGSGCGYASGSQVAITIHKPEAIAFQAAMPDASGCISFSFTTDGAGTYLVEASQKIRHRWRVLASRELPVQ
jgi:hypothetical protein